MQPCARSTDLFVVSCPDPTLAPPLRYSSHMTNGILLTRQDQEIAQWSPDPFPRERVGSGHETRLLLASFPVFDRLQYTAILQAIKNWRRERPGNEARLDYCAKRNSLAELVDDDKQRGTQSQIMAMGEYILQR